ncbi:MAG: hypothetical protein RRX92_02300 [Lachnospiraceae bacterium]
MKTRRFWHYVLESGLPEDGTWCFVISSVNRDIDLFVGGYNKNNHTNNSFLREN